MAHIFSAIALLIIMWAQTNNFFPLSGIIPQPVGWEYMARGHLTNIVIFYSVIVFFKQNRTLYHCIPAAVGLIAGVLLLSNIYGYYIQQGLQCLLLSIVGHFSYQFYKLIPRYSYQLKILFSMSACYHIGTLCLHAFLMIFFTPVAHPNPLTPSLKVHVGLFWWTPLISMILLCCWNIYYYHSRKAAKNFDPNQSYIIHFLPLKDGVRTWLCFLFSMLPIPHYAVYGFHERKQEWGIWKYSKKENGLVFHPLSSGKLDKLFKWGLVLICEPVKIINRLDPLVGKVPYNIWTGDTCHKLAKYIKGELPFDDTWFKIARS
jgi:hypothetical protein